MRNACWIIKGTNIHSEHVIFIAFPPIARTHLTLRYTFIACLVQLMSLVAVSVLRDERKLNLGYYGGIADLSLLLQCDDALLGICGHTLED
jgi:hypothetical protein